MLQEFNELNKHFLNTILKFITRMQTIIINERLIHKTKSSQKFKRIIPAEKQSHLPRKKGEGRKRSKNKFILNENGRNQNDISDSNISNISNDISAHQKSFLSDNEVVTQSKVNLLKVMKGVSKNIIKEMKETGKEIPKLDEAVKQDLLVDNPKTNGNVGVSKINTNVHRFRDNSYDVELQLDESNIPNNITHNELSFNSNFMEEIEENNNNNSPDRGSKKINQNHMINTKRKKGDPNMDTKEVKTTSDINVYSKQIEISIQNKLSDTKINSIKPSAKSKKDSTYNSYNNNGLSNTLQVDQNKNQRKKNNAGCRCILF